MDSVVQLRRMRTSAYPAPRSLADGPDYRPDWRFLTFQQYAADLAVAKDEAATLQQILSQEKDRVLRELLKFEFGGSSRWHSSISYALACHRTQDNNPIAASISAMVVAARTCGQIAEEIGAKRRHVIAYELLFFDVRRFAENRYWIKHLCYFPQRVTSLGEDASRWLITACERSWAGLSAIFSTSRSPSAPAGQTAAERFSLGLASRCADYVNHRDLAGTAPDLHDIDLLFRSTSIASELAPSLHQLDYPNPVSCAEARREKERRELVQTLPLESRKRLGNLIARAKSGLSAPPADGAS